MAAYKFLKNLILGKDNDCIKVRVTREWQVKSSDNKYVVSKNYILLDEEVCSITSMYILYMLFFVQSNIQITDN